MISTIIINNSFDLKSIPKNKQILVYCDTGFKTSIASSILQKHSYLKVANLEGGFSAWKNAGFSIKKTLIKNQNLRQNW